MDPYSEVLSQVSPATPQEADPVSSTPIATTSAGSNLCAAKAPFSSQRAAPYAAWFQTSKSQQWSLGVEQTSNAADIPLPEGKVQERARSQGRRVPRPTSGAGVRGLHHGRFSTESPS